MTTSPLIGAAGTVPHPRPAPSQPAEPEPGPSDPADAEQASYAADRQAGYAAASQAGYATRSEAGPAADYAAADSGQAERAAEADREDGSGAAWPYQSFLELGALPTAAACARLHTKLVLWEWELDALVRNAALVVSELVSNAVQASLDLTGSRFAGRWAPGTPPVRLWLSADKHRLVIQVWDGSDLPPVPRPVEPEADSGRGLLLVGALSAEWGCYTPEASSGKVVWSVVSS